MLKVVQEKYGQASAGRDEPLVIHLRSRPTTASHLAILVHGLGGSRYGENATWGDLPSLVFESFPNVDLGMYTYRSLTRRLVFWRSIPLEREAEVLSGLITSLKDEYQRFILFGHSMGGLLCKFVAMRLTEDSMEIAQKLQGLFLMATPQLGSLRLPRWMGGLTRDAQALSPHSELVSKLSRFFEDRVCGRVNPSLDDRLHLPTWALVGAEDFWVDPVSAGIGIPAAQKIVVRGSHAEVVKPKGGDSDGFRFIQRCVKEAVLARGRSLRHRVHSPARLSELRLIREMAAREIPAQVSDLTLMEKWWTWNKRVFFVVRYVNRSFGSQEEKVVGYICVLPLVAEAAEAMQRGRLNGITLKPEDLAQTDEATEAVYIGAIVGEDIVSKGAVLHFLEGRLRSLAERKRLLVMARPATDDGLKVILGNGMVEVENSAGPDLPNLYRMHLDPEL